MIYLINSKQYFVLKCVNDHPGEFLDDFWNILNGSEETFKIIDSLIRLGYLVDIPVSSPHLQVAITIDGFTALEEYNHQQRAENREEEAISVAKEANQTSSRSNKIAIIAIIISIFTLIAQIFDRCLLINQNTNQCYYESQQSEYQSNN